jgi:Transposase DDE domain
MVANPILFQSPAMDIVALYCDLDDFSQAFAPTWHRHLLPAPGRHRQRTRHLSMSEMMTLVIAFQDSDYRTFKHFYRKEVCRHWRAEFPHLVSYQRLIECLPSVLVPLAAYLETRLGRTHGIAFVDSLPLPVCHNRRIYSHQVFADMAQRGKSSVDWFYGFKLHFVINDRGDLLALRFTPGNVDDRAPVPDLVEGLRGKLFGDRGDISQELFEQLWGTGVPLITKLKRKMKNKLLPLWDKLLLRKRALIESVGEQLKHVCQIGHTRHRSVPNAFIHAFAALAAYTWHEHKPSLHLTEEEQRLLAEAF